MVCIIEVHEQLRDGEVDCLYVLDLHHGLAGSLVLVFNQHGHHPFLLIPHDLHFLPPQHEPHKMVHIPDDDLVLDHFLHKLSKLCEDGGVVEEERLL